VLRRSDVQGRTKKSREKGCQLGDGCVDDGDQGGGCGDEKDVAERGREG